NGDTKVESDEAFSVVLSSPSNATLRSEERRVGKERNADAATPPNSPTVSITAPVATTEGNSGQKAFVFTVTLSGSPTNAVVVYYSTQDGTATVADSDYQGVANNTVNFAAGTTTLSTTVTTWVNGDTKVESDEAFSVVLSSPSNATL